MSAMLGLVRDGGDADRDAVGDLELAEVLSPIAGGFGVNVPDRDAQLVVAMRRYGDRVAPKCPGAVVVSAGRVGLSAGSVGVIESDGEALRLSPWGPVSWDGWLPIGVVSLGRGD